MRIVKIGVVGLGYWGPNLARNFNALPSADLGWICDGSQERLDLQAKNFPGARPTRDLDDLLGDDQLDAVVLATDVQSHADLAQKVLNAGKHVFVEKPLARTLEGALAVERVANGSGKILMVGHLLEYHPGVAKLRELIGSGELGDLRYIYSNRLNLGQIRSDENALWSLGAHDVSVVLRLVGEEPELAVAHGESYMRPGVEDVVFCYLRFPSGLAAHMHLSWLDPHKERRFTVVGATRMATFDDMSADRKVTVYDKGFDHDFNSHGDYVARSGDLWSPRVSNEEPLQTEAKHFVDCIVEGRTPETDAASGVRVVRVLDALQRSLDESRPMPIQDSDAAAV